MESEQWRAGEESGKQGPMTVAGTAAQGAAARLIVCEPTGRWAVALRRELADAGVRVWETRTLAGCREELEQSPASFVVLQMTDNLAGLLRFMARLSREFPATRLAAAARKERGRGEGKEEKGADGLRYRSSCPTFSPLAAPDG